MRIAFDRDEAPICPRPGIRLGAEGIRAVDSPNGTRASLNSKPIRGYILSRNIPIKFEGPRSPWAAQPMHKLPKATRARDEGFDSGFQSVIGRALVKNLKESGCGGKGENRALPTELMDPRTKKPLTPSPPPLATASRHRRLLPPPPPPPSPSPSPSPPSSTQSIASTTTSTTTPASSSTANSCAREANILCACPVDQLSSFKTFKTVCALFAWFACACFRSDWLV
jgi:hypothetical protein